MSEKQPGLFKRLFRFGKKKEPEEDIASDVIAAGPSEVEQAEQQRPADEAEARRVAEEAERAEVERARKEAEEQAQRGKAEADRLAAEEAVRLQSEAVAEQKHQREKEEARQAAEKAKQEAQAKAAQVLKEQEEEKRQREQAEREAVEEAKRQQAEAERVRQEEEQTRLAAEQVEQEKLAAEEKAREEERLQALERQRAEEERLSREAAEKEAAEKAAAEKAAIEAEAQRLAEVQVAQEAETVEDQPLEPQPAPRLEPDGGPSAEEPKQSWFGRLKGGLARSSNQLTESITGVFTKRKLDEDTLQDLEDVLIRADLGVETAMSITDKLAAQRMGRDISSEEVRSIMAEEVEAVLEPVAAELELDLDYQPHVILVVGVNGSGKTTTIGKLSQKLYDAGFSTLLVAGDTFRAAAIEQLKIWGERTQSPVLSRPLGSDAAGLAFDAYEQAKVEGRDVMLMDTAGRLQNRTELMDELAKIVRVLKKQDPSAPHTVLLTLDATTGQNALNQVEIFKDVAGVNGIVMTKLDGTARGGILVAISAKHKLPVFFLGVGEQVDDLEPFEARDFARSIAGLDV